jgi:hypothetical protein
MTPCFWCSFFCFFFFFSSWQSRLWAPCHVKVLFLQPTSLLHQEPNLDSCCLIIPATSLPASTALAPQACLDFCCLTGRAGPATDSCCQPVRLCAGADVKAHGLKIGSYRVLATYDKAPDGWQVAPSLTVVRDGSAPSIFNAIMVIHLQVRCVKGTRAVITLIFTRHVQLKPRCCRQGLCMRSLQHYRCFTQDECNGSAPNGVPLNSASAFSINNVHRFSNRMLAACPYMQMHTCALVCLSVILRAFPLPVQDSTPTRSHVLLSAIRMLCLLASLFAYREGRHCQGILRPGSETF